MLALLFFTFCSLIAAGHGKTITSMSNIQYETDEQLTLCLKNVVKEIIEHDQFIIDVILINLDVLDISKLHELKARYIARTYAGIDSKLFQRLYVIRCFNVEEFRKYIRRAITNEYFNSYANFVVVMENFRDNDNMTDFLLLNNLYNVTILAKDEVGYGIFTFQSIINPCKKRLTLAAVSHCSSYGGGTHIFPKIYDIRGCSFQLLARNFYPLTNFDDKGEEGTEQRVLRHFAKHAEIDIEVIPVSRVDKLGQLILNNSFTEVLAKVARHEVEGAIGGYFMQAQGLTGLTYSNPVTINYMIAVLPRRDYLNTWQELVQKANSILILVIVLCIIFSILAYILSLFPTARADPVRDILIIFGYFLNKVTMHKLKSGIPETLVICSLLFSIFIIPFTLQAYVFSINTHPRRGYETKDLSEVLQSYRLAATSVWGSQGIAKNRKNCESRLRCLRMVMKKTDESLFTLLENDLFEVYKWWLVDDFCNMRLYKINEPVMTLVRTAYFRRGSLFVRPYDKFVMDAMSAGLVDHHYNDIVLKEKLKCKSKHVSSTVALKLTDLHACFVLLIIGMLCSTVTFAWEVLSRQTNWLNLYKIY